MQSLGNDVFCQPCLFQSSPGQKAGCNLRRLPRKTLTSMFQSSPGQKAGCNMARWFKSGPDEPVSILTRPEGRMQFVVGEQGFDGLVVSILTRPEGRMQLSICWAMATRSSGFQSSPGQKAGCNHARHFNVHRDFHVSILTRPEGRMQFGVPLITRVNLSFQSSPGQKAGCNPMPLNAKTVYHGFNPHPARRPDAMSIAEW